MRFLPHSPSLPAAIITLVGSFGLLLLPCCSSGGSGWDIISTPFAYQPLTTGPTGPSSTGQSSSGGIGQSDRTPVDPCNEAQTRKFVTVSMRNLCDDYVHYFFIAVAFVDVDETDPNVSLPFFENVAFPNGAVCPNDVSLYTQFGYIEIRAGEAAAFGDYCVGGPALIYFHRSGQFRRSASGGAGGLGSAIAPAQGSSPTYDEFFTSAGAQIPVPNLILFHNPGTSDGYSLKISTPTVAPCDFLTNVGTQVCLRDAWYYVSEDDIMTGSTALGVGSGRRVPAEIQGTGCECTGLAEAWQILAPSRVTALGANCNEFLRGGRISYAFLREDDTPSFPQLLWRVKDASGAQVHDFDTRAGVIP
ncbi:MAG: hypothetical protein ABIG44_00125 [Planctomycetota bacterium]